MRSSVQKKLLFSVLLIFVIVVFLLVSLCANWLGGPLFTSDTSVITGEIVDVSEDNHISVNAPNSEILSVIPISADAKVYNNHGIRLFASDISEMLQVGTKVKTMVSANVIYDEVETLSGEIQSNQIHEHCYYLVFIE